MTQQIIDVGPSDDVGGDDLRPGFVKINENFAELYAAGIPIPDKATLVANSTVVAGVISPNQGGYIITGNIDLITDTIDDNLGGVAFFGVTATQSRITTNSSSPTITFSGTGGASGLQGNVGLLVNNTGTGAAVRGDGSIFFTSNLLTTAAGNGLELDDMLGYAGDGWTFGSGVTNGAVLTGTNPRTIMDNFNASSVSGVGVDVQGPMSGPLDMFRPIIESIGTGMKCNQAIQGFGISDGLISSSGAKGVEFTGSSVGALRFTGCRLAGNTANTAASGDGHALDVEGASTISTLIVDDSNLFVLGAGQACFNTSADSGTNIGLRADLSDSSFIALAGSTALINATKKDVKLKFSGCIGNTDAVSTEVANSVIIGCFTLDAQTTTTLSFQGADGTITAFADSAGNPGVDTTVSTAATPASGAPVAIFGTTSYNGLFTAANVVGGVSFDIVRTFVADDATGSWESGWVKVAGATTDCPTIERCVGSADNELEFLGGATISTIYNANIAGQKSGATVQGYQFALFCDDQTGNGFVKVNGSIPVDLTNRSANVSLRIPSAAPSGSKFTDFVRNIDAANDFICDANTVDVSGD